jgi:Tol biopolymer transport system component
MRILVVLIVLTFTVTVLVAGISVKGPPYQVAGNEVDVRMNPVWSPDASLIAFTSSNYQGLWITDPEGNSIQQISDELSAGFGFSWASDSKSLVYKVTKYDGYRRFNALKIFNIETRNLKQLTPYLPRFSGLPYWSNGDQNIILQDKESVKIYQSGHKNLNLNDVMGNNRICFLKNHKMYLYDSISNTARQMDPIKDSRYIDAQFSPDESYLTFQVVGGNMFVMKRDGSELTDLGKGHRPRWSPDGTRLVYMICADDGYQFTQSDIYVIDRDGRNRERLTDTDDALEMNPDWSPKGNKIAFDRLDTGAIYVLELIEE